MRAIVTGTDRTFGDARQFALAEAVGYRFLPHTGLHHTDNCVNANSSEAEVLSRDEALERWRGTPDVPFAERPDRRWCERCAAVEIGRSSGPTSGEAPASIAEAAAREVLRAWRDADSVFTPGVSVWNATNTAQLLERFVARADESGSSFDEKLRRQLSEASDGSRQLFAELYYLNLLALGDYRGDTKRRLIGLPLQLMDRPVAIPAAAADALDAGVFNGGVYFKTGRFQQLSYLIRMSHDLLSRSDQERGSILGDPWRLRDHLQSLGGDVPSQRNSLLYLLHPDTHLSIASQDHKKRIVAAFADRIPAPVGDLDRDLLSIHSTLSAEAGRYINFYRPPYLGTWDPRAEAERSQEATGWPAFMHWARRLTAVTDLNAEERAFKVTMAERLDRARSLLLASDPEWPVEVKRALGHGNLLNHFFKAHFNDELAARPEQVREALLAVWEGEPRLESLDDLERHLDALGAQSSKYTPGEVVALGSVLLMARDLNQYPPFLPTPVTTASALLGLGGSPRPAIQRYERLLKICDGLLERASDVGIELSDRLDAQGLLWALVKSDPPGAWPLSEQQEFLRWRGGVADETAEQPVRTQAWFVRGANVNGTDLVPRWVQGRFISLWASHMPADLEPGSSRDQVAEVVERSYAHVDYASRTEKVDELYAFLTRMKVGDLVVTTDEGRAHVARLTGEPTFEPEADRSRLRRAVEWLTGEGRPATVIGAALAARLTIQYDVVDLTAEMTQVEALLEQAESGARPAPLELPAATLELSDAVHADVDWLDGCIEILRERRQMIFYGPPGTGKTWIAQKLARHIAGDNVRLVQFHPAYTYEDFFEGYRPTADGKFRLKPGPMRRVASQARENPSTPFVLVIDEINRGNLAKIFGELYFLLEYRSQTIDLLYADDAAEGFSLPENVFIIGTMNTSDRSIALVDTAMRRRFAFRMLHPSQEPTKSSLGRWWATIDHPSSDLPAALLNALNERIADPEFKVGPSYFMRPSLLEPGVLERVWDSEILPLLEDHHFGDGTDVPRQYGLRKLREIAEQPHDGGENDGAS